MFFSISSSLASLLAFIFTIAMWNVAKVRFQKAGFQATFGPLVRPKIGYKRIQIDFTIIVALASPRRDSHTPGRDVYLVQEDFVESEKLCTHGNGSVSP